MAEVTAILSVHGKGKEPLGVIHSRQGNGQEEEGARAEREGRVDQEGSVEEESGYALET